MALKHNELSFMPASIVVDNDEAQGELEQEQGERGACEAAQRQTKMKMKTETWQRLQSRAWQVGARRSRACCINRVAA